MTDPWNWAKVEQVLETEPRTRDLVPKHFLSTVLTLEVTLALRIVEHFKLRGPRTTLNLEVLTLQDLKREWKLDTYSI